jgi:hypothetical protein
MSYCIIETDDGRVVVERFEEATAEETAERYAGTLVDPGPYETYEEACDALDALEQEMANENATDVPATQALEGRFESRE